MKSDTMTSDAAQRTHSHRRDEHFPRSGWRIALVLTCIAAIAAGATTPLHGGLDFGWTPLEGRTLGVWILVAGYLAMGWMLIEATWTGDLPVPFQARYVIERRTPASRTVFAITVAMTLIALYALLVVVTAGAAPGT